jgi:hypothetical protein
MLLEGIDWRMPARTWQPAMAGRAESFFCIDAAAFATIPFMADLSAMAEDVRALIEVQASTIARQTAELLAQGSMLEALRLSDRPSEADAVRPLVGAARRRDRAADAGAGGGVSRVDRRAGPERTRDGGAALRCLRELFDVSPPADVVGQLGFSFER